MDIVPLLSTIILISTLVTIVLSVVSYVAFKIRERRRPWVKGAGQPVSFFTRYVPQNGTDRSTEKK